MDHSDDLYKERMAALLKAIYAAKYVKDDNVPAQVKEGLYLGSVGAAHNKTFLKSVNITHILTVANSIPPAYPNDFTYKVVDVPDREEVNIAQFFDECFCFINEAKRKGGVLVHCFVGRSRSVTIVVAYLMKKHGMSLSEALNLVKSKRSVAAPNSGFMLQLKNYEKSLKETSFLQYMKLPAFKDAAIETVDADSTMLKVNVDVVRPPSDNVPSPCVSPQKGKRKRKAVIGNETKPDDCLSAKKGKIKLTFCLTDEREENEQIQEGPKQDGQELGGPRHRANTHSQEIGSLGVGDVQDRNFLGSKYGLVGTSCIMNRGVSMQRSHDEEFDIPLVRSRGKNLDGDGSYSFYELNHPSATNDVSVPPFKNIKKGTTYDDPAICRELVDFISTPAEVINISKTNDELSNYFYYHLAQLAVIGPEMRRRWTRSIREVVTSKDTINRLRGEGQKNEARIFELEQQLANFQKERKSMKKKVRLLEKTVEDLKYDLSKKEGLLEQATSNQAAQKVRFEAKTRCMEDIIKALEKENGALLSEKKWLINEGYALAFEKFRNSREFLSSVAELQSKCFMAGYQQGLVVCEGRMKRGLSITTDPNYDVAAFSKFEESAKSFDTVAYPFWSKFSQASDLSLDFIKSIEPDRGDEVAEPGGGGDKAVEIGGSKGKLVVLDPGVPDSTDPKVGGVV